MALQGRVISRMFVIWGNQWLRKQVRVTPTKLFSTSFQVSDKMRIPSPISTEELEKFETYLFDADGVLWAETTAIPGAVDFVSGLLNKGKQVFIITNNATKTSEEYAEKVKKFGFTEISQSNIISPAVVLVDYLKERGYKNKKIYVLGVTALQKTLETGAGVKCIGVGPDHFDSYTKGEHLPVIDIEEGVSAVVAGFDPHISYPKVMKAVNFLKKSDTEFLVTNEDSTVPGPVKGVVVPGEGVVSAMIKCATEKEAKVFGKPNTRMGDYIKHHFNVDPTKAIMFGDRLDTDVKFANASGFVSCLALTRLGCHNLNTVQKALKDQRMDLLPKYTFTFPGSD